MTHTQIYLVAAIIVYGGLFGCWKHNDIPNVIVKMVLLLMTVASIWFLVRN